MRELVTALTTNVAEREKRLDLAEQTRMIVRGIVRIRSTRLRRLRRRLGLLALVAGLAAAGTQAVRLIPSPGKATIDVTSDISLAFGILTVLAAVGIAIATQQVSAVESDIEDINQTLDDKALVARLLRQILEVTESEQPWTFDGWINAVEEWGYVARGHLLRTAYDSDPVHCSRRVGAFEFARLVYAKAKEQGVVVERESWVGKHLLVTFEFNRSSGA